MATRGHRKDYLFSYLLCALLLVLGGKSAHWVVTDTLRAYASTGWPDTEGVITSSKIGKSYAVRGGSLHSALVTYQYDVEGKDYMGSVIGYPPRRGSRHEAEQKLSKYTIGTAVRVFYHPDNPGIACLEPGNVSIFFIIMMGGVSAILAGSGIWLGLFLWKQSH